MKKKVLSLFLVLCLMLTLAAPASAAKTRDTEFFRKTEHPNIDFSDMEIEILDVDAVAAQMDGIRKLAGNSANLKQVREQFLAISDIYKKAYTMESLSYYYMSADVYDDAAAALNQETADVETRILDALNLLTRDILRSPCAAALDGIIPEERRSYYLEYTAMTNIELALFNRETELVAEYIQNDENWEEIFLKMVEVRNAIAKSAGYRNYYEYAYDVIYWRDYAPLELNGYRRAAIEMLIPIQNKIAEMLRNEYWRSSFSRDFSDNVGPDLMEPCLADMSDELLDSFQYLRRHGLLDNTFSYNKASSTFTYDLPMYNCAYIFTDPDMDFYDFSALVHEFGHYNNFYWTPMEWDGTTKNVDISEVHSQALELLFFHYYPELFGEDARALQLYMMYQRLYTLVNALLIDSLEQYIYSAENLTIDGINREYVRLRKEYREIPADSSQESSSAWAGITHFFITPCYYISYSVSVAGAWDFWIESLSDFYGTVDKYLEFTALDNFSTFKGSFEAVGMQQPLTANMIGKLADALQAFLYSDPDGSICGYKDVKATDLYANAVRLVSSYGLMDGVSADVFDPGGALTRGQLVTALWRMEGEPNAGFYSFSDIAKGTALNKAAVWAKEEELMSAYDDGRFGADDPVNREQLASVLYRYVQRYDMGYKGNEKKFFEFSDRNSVSSWAYDAMCWLRIHNILNGTGQNRISPKGTAERAETAYILMRLAYVMLENDDFAADGFFGSALEDTSFSGLAA